jgi:hypothetical protein
VYALPDAIIDGIIDAAVSIFHVRPYCARRGSEQVVNRDTLLPYVATPRTYEVQWKQKLSRHQSVISATIERYNLELQYHQTLRLCRLRTEGQIVGATGYETALWL